MGKRTSFLVCAAKDLQYLGWGGFIFDNTQECLQVCERRTISSQKKYTEVLEGDKYLLKCDEVYLVELMNKKKCCSYLIGAYVNLKQGFRADSTILRQNRCSF